jgi:hypothetical protein
VDEVMTLAEHVLTELARPFPFLAGEAVDGTRWGGRRIGAARAQHLAGSLLSASIAPASASRWATPRGRGARHGRPGALHRQELLGGRTVHLAH